MAHPDRARVLRHDQDRYDAVVRVLYRVLVLNLAVALVKIVLGYATGAVSILSDGFHSLTDSASNVVALVGVSIARRPPDKNHPYGHRKYETMASLGILVFLVIVLVQVLSAAYDRVVNGGAPRVFPEGIGIMTVTLVVNLFVVSYEERGARRLNSEVLRADAKHTRSDVLTTGAVLGALLGVWWGYPLLDPLAAIFVAAFIGRAGWGSPRKRRGFWPTRSSLPRKTSGKWCDRFPRSSAATRSGPADPRITSSWTCTSGSTGGRRLSRRTRRRMW